MNNYSILLYFVLNRNYFLYKRNTYSSKSNETSVYTSERWRLNNYFKKNYQQTEEKKNEEEKKKSGGKLQSEVGRKKGQSCGGKLCKHVRKRPLAVSVRLGRNPKRRLFLTRVGPTAFAFLLKKKKKN